MRSRYATVLLFFLLSLACQPDKGERKQAHQSIPPGPKAGPPVIVEFIFGKFCGECGGNCAPMFRLDMEGNQTTLWGDYRNNFFKGHPDSLKFETDLNQASRMAKAYEILERLPGTLLKHPKTEATYGCPDCTDGCGIYIAFTDKRSPYKSFRLDFAKSDTIPPEITDYAGFVREKINEIMK